MADLPQLKALWIQYHDTYQVDVLVVPSTPITARPIDDMEPYVNINGRMVRLTQSGLQAFSRQARQ